MLLSYTTVIGWVREGSEREGRKKVRRREEGCGGILGKNSYTGLLLYLIKTYFTYSAIIHILCKKKRKMYFLA